MPRTRAPVHHSISQTTEKVTGENHIRNALRQGEPLALVFKRLGTF